MVLKNIQLQLSIIIVNYNVKYFLEHCLLSVKKAIANIKAEVFVVDNRSSDNSIEYLQPKFPFVHFIINKENLGFAKANNIALEKASGELVLFLNPDTIVPEDCFELCINFFNNHKEAGALGVKMLDGSGQFLKESKRSFPSPSIAFYKISGLSSIFPNSKKFGKYHLKNLPESNTNAVDVLAGAFMMVRKNVLDITGSFDEQFFMYGEDVDLSYRIQQAGYKNFYFADTTIIHFKGESTKKGSLNYVLLFYKAMSLFVKKHFLGNKAFWFNFFIQMAIWLRAFFGAVSRGIRLIGLPIFDAILILISFWGTKIFWNHFVKPEIIYEQRLLNLFFPLFTVFFLGAAFFYGLYEKYYRSSSLRNSSITAILLIFVVYALLPESMRFSRAIILFGSITSFLFLFAFRRFLLLCRIVEKAEELSETQHTLVVGSELEYYSLKKIYTSVYENEKFLGRVSLNKKDLSAIGCLQNLAVVLNQLPVKEVVFCEGELLFKQIIEHITNVPTKIRVKIFSQYSESIISSESKNQAGEVLSFEKGFKIALPYYRRSKRLFDIVVCIFFLISFPFHIIFQKKPISFFINLYRVLIGKNTWIGYCLGVERLPKIKNGILSNTGMPHEYNQISLDAKNIVDTVYAKEYELVTDVKILMKGYRYLYRKFKI